MNATERTRRTRFGSGSRLALKEHGLISIDCR
jgi:hypothetical protein